MSATNDTGIVSMDPVAAGVLRGLLAEDAHRTVRIVGTPG